MSELAEQSEQIRLFHFDLFAGFARQVESVPGAVAEVGVYRGASAVTIARAFAGRPLHLFDTFRGMPQPEDCDGHFAGEFADTSVELVASRLQEYSGWTIHQGLFPQTAGPVENEHFAFVHVDCDLRKSVHDCCEFFWPRMSPGGVILFDDYNYLRCRGAKQAVDEFFGERICRLAARAFVVKDGN